MVRQSLKEMKEERRMNRIITEATKNTIRRLINENDSLDIKRRSVMNMLKDEKYKDAALAYDLWHPKDQSEKDTYRSLFSKKATGEPDNDGNVRHFTDDEINKLYELLRKK